VINDTRRATERLMLMFADLDRSVSEAIEDATPEGEFLSKPAILILSRLDLHGPCRPNDLAELLQMSTSGTSKQIDRLEHAGFVGRNVDIVPDDRRAVVVALTPNGRKLIRRFITALTPQLGETRWLLHTLSQTLSDAE